MFSERDSFCVRAAGKINLYLEVLGRRENGYHDIRSVMAPVSVFDELTLERTNRGIEIEVVRNGSPGLGELTPAGVEENLASRAAMALKSVSRYEGGARIRLEKHIPIGGGLGGGSADGAAVLVGLNRLWGTDLSWERLLEIGGELGCDIPAMMYGRAVCVEGLGEQVTPIEGPRDWGCGRWWVVLANPGFSVSTKDIYERHRSALTSAPIPHTSMVSALERGDVEAASRSLFNALEGTVFRKYPIIEITAKRLREAGALGVLLSGSGATVFGLARDEGDAAGVAKRAGEALGESVWIETARILPDGVMVAHGPLEA